MTPPESPDVNLPSLSPGTPPPPKTLGPQPKVFGPRVAAVPGYLRGGKFVGPHLRMIHPTMKFSHAQQQPSWQLGAKAPVISCRNCRHFNWSSPGTCTAFPNGIPHGIAYGQYLHLQALQGDGGITFKTWVDKLDVQAQQFPNLPEEEE